MFPLWSSVRRAHPAQVPAGAPEVPGAHSMAGAVLKLGLLAVSLVAAVPGAASAQALGTMQVTARVRPGAPSWAGLAEAQTLARQVLFRPSGFGPHGRAEVRRAGLVQAHADFAPASGPRRLVITVDYPRN